MVDSEDNKVILVLNCGSSSLKYDLIKMPHRLSLGKGLVERIGEDKGSLEQKSGERKIVLEQKIKDHREALELVMRAITDKDQGILADVAEITGIGHRVVHGGDKYSSSIIIDEDVV
ncbi:MAG TPA: acetate kinase, partial [Candidatus Rifleibacterium sp.]|nr:acetate kinase [Candidatus Rifleibacterium sp.]